MNNVESHITNAALLIESGYDGIADLKNWHAGRRQAVKFVLKDSRDLIAHEIKRIRREHSKKSITLSQGKKP